MEAYKCFLPAVYSLSDNIVMVDRQQNMFSEPEWKLDYIIVKLPLTQISFGFSPDNTCPKKLFPIVMYYLGNLYQKRKELILVWTLVFMSVQHCKTLYQIYCRKYPSSVDTTHLGHANIHYSRVVII